MPFSDRDKGRLFDRLRGKSGQDLLNEVKTAFDSDNMFVDSPTFAERRGFPRGFPFDDLEPRSSRSFFSRERNRDRPFGDRLGTFKEPVHEPPSDEEIQPKRRVVETKQETAAPTPSPLCQHGLRNTVPLAQGPAVERPTRAMSAPPSRFTTTFEMPISGENSAPQPKQDQSSEPKPAQPGNVRVIPIQVEGRAEPLVNSNVDSSTNFASEQPSFDARLPRDFGNFRKHSQRFQQEQPQAPPRQQAPPAQQQQHQQRPAPPKKTSVDEPDRVTPTPPPPQVPIDPAQRALNRIMEVQQEIDKLAKDVSAATLASRKDKQYVYLDEMLTRQLLRLDDVDCCGQDNIRQARKDTIKNIQQCIAMLEKKAPGEAMDVDTTGTEESSSENVNTPVTEPEGSAMEVAPDSQPQEISPDPPA